MLHLLFINLLLCNALFHMVTGSLVSMLFHADSRGLRYSTCQPSAGDGPVLFDVAVAVQLVILELQPSRRSALQPTHDLATYSVAVFTASFCEDSPQHVNVAV